MATKELSTKVAIVGRGAKCKGGKSAVEQSSYISRTTLYSDYYGENFYPKYSEDLVHTEILLAENAPERYRDRNILWNAVEESEKKSLKAQIARSYKVSLPNEWSHILLTMRPILEDRTWGAKQRKVYFYDEQGNKIRKKNGQYKCTTEDVCCLAH